MPLPLPVAAAVAAWPRQGAAAAPLQPAGAAAAAQGLWLQAQPLLHLPCLHLVQMGRRLLPLLPLLLLVLLAAGVAAAPPPWCPLGSRQI